MKKIVASTILAFLLPVLASAQVPGGAIVTNGKNVSLTAPDDAQGNLRLVVPNATPNFEVWTGGSRRLLVNGSGDTTFASTSDVAYAPYVPTMAATPVAGTNDFAGLVNAVPTAAANTAALLPAGPTAGTLKYIINTGPNAIRVKMGSTNTVNGGTAGGYISVASLQQARCIADSATNWNCQLSTVPTPAGP